MELDKNTLDTIIEKLNRILPGRNIGTGLQIDAENTINNILPSGWNYNLNFNMSGEVNQTISYQGNIIYKF